MMRFIQTLAVAAILMSSSMAPIAPANASPTDNNGANAEVHAYCVELVESGSFPTMNYGECVSFNVTTLQGFKTHFCDYIRENDDFASWGFASFSDCVRRLLD